jgi:general secretion pathway protein G
MIVRQTLSKATQARRSAFTLLEVLVVVAIIVMLAGVGSFYLFQRYEEAKGSKAKADCNGLAQQAEVYKINNGQYPASIEALAQQQPGGGGPLIKPEAVNDPWGKPYKIDPSGQHNSGQCCDVYTTDPKGKVIGNFR